MRFAYADPPYLGCCSLYDHEHGSDGLCWDSPETHRQLIDALAADYPDIRVVHLVPVGSGRGEV